MNKKIILIDYGLGNLQSITNVFDYLKIPITISSNANEIGSADALILPGVGSFGEGMKNLNSLGISQTIIKSIQDGRPFMGICLGLQLLFSDSEEFGDHKGLGIIKGRVKKFQPSEKNKNFKIPLVGWNKTQSKHPDREQWKNSPMKNIRDNDFMYFTHSYYVEPESKALILSESSVGEVKYCSSILQDNIFAVQFHPEKSGKPGIDIYKNWTSLI